MKGAKAPLKRGSSGPPNGKKSNVNGGDSFFKSDSKKRRKVGFRDDNIDSGDSDEENGYIGSDASSGGHDDEEIDEYANETPAEKKLRLTNEAFENVQAIRKKKGHEEEEEEEEEAVEGRVYEKEGERDSIAALKLMKEQLEESGRLRRALASRVQEPETADGFRFIVKHTHPVTGVCLSDDDSRGFSASKDGLIKHWDVESGKTEKYKWPTDKVLKSHGVRNPEGRVTKHSKSVLALAVSSDGRYLATGGLDRHIHLWDTRTREHVQAFPGHRAAVSCLAFRHGTSELFSGSFDRSIKIWNISDRTYINTLFGHQSDVLSIDCLRKDRVLAVGRDRTMQFFKVPEESRVIFRSSTSALESCCFIDNEDFFSGSDDGSVELRTVQRKKPVFIVKNAHTLPSDIQNEEKNNGGVGGKLILDAHSWVSSVAVCRGSDLGASGAGSGLVRLWALDSSPKSIRPLFDLPLVGFVNSMAFAKSGKFLVAGVGKEPRLGRWGRTSDAENGVAIHQIQLSEEVYGK
ncbi:U3 snoRNP-associated protein-like YAO [Linum perenne]